MLGMQFKRVPTTVNGKQSTYVSTNTPEVDVHIMNWGSKGDMWDIWFGRQFMGSWTNKDEMIRWAESKVTTLVKVGR